jgi:hypothetical protein
MIVTSFFVCLSASRISPRRVLVFVPSTADDGVNGRSTEQEELNPAHGENRSLLLYKLVGAFDHHIRISCAARRARTTGKSAPTRQCVSARVYLDHAPRAPHAHSRTRPHGARPSVLRSRVILLRAQGLPSRASSRTRAFPRLRASPRTRAFPRLRAVPSSRAFPYPFISHHDRGRPGPRERERRVRRAAAHAHGGAPRADARRARRRARRPARPRADSVRRRRARH